MIEMVKIKWKNAFGEGVEPIGGIWAAVDNVGKGVCHSYIFCEDCMLDGHCGELVYEI